MFNGWGFTAIEPPPKVTIDAGVAESVTVRVLGTVIVAEQPVVSSPVLVSALTLITPEIKPELPSESPLPMLPDQV